MGALWKRCGHQHLFAVEVQHATGFRTTDVDAFVAGMNIVDVQFPEHQRPFVAVRVVSRALEFKAFNIDMQRPMKYLLIKVERDNAVEAG